MSGSSCQHGNYVDKLNGLGCALCDREEVTKTPPAPNYEFVNHPAHYGGDTIYEVIKVMEAWLSPEEFVGAMKFNIHKYLARAGKKDGHRAEQDAQKAAWYSSYLVGYLTRRRGSDNAV